MIEFTKKTLPSDGTDKLFIGCVLILFSIAGGYKPRYFCSRENLESIVLLAKEKIGSSNLLAFYVERVNQTKGINKYLEESASWFFSAGTTGLIVIFIHLLIYHQT